jgi:hypothetical protein
MIILMSLGRVCSIAACRPGLELIVAEDHDAMEDTTVRG